MKRTILINKKGQSRLFIAVDLPIRVVQEIIRIQNIIKKEVLFEGKFINPEQIHLTIKFIGEVSIKQLPAIEKSLDKIISGTMEAQLGILDVFSVNNRVKIIFISIICPQLTQFVQKVERAVLPWSLAENNSFVNHVTIARVKKIENTNKKRLLDLLHSIMVKPLQFTIDSFVLKESILSEQGAIYIDKAIYKLNDD
jgi:RNA 2',3'-cyclic 3'-phosphodiesterase